jgi:sugar phosphate permease
VGAQSAQPQNRDKLKSQSSPTRDYFKQLVFVLLLIALTLFFIALIFGRVLGYRLTLSACFWFGVVVAGCAGLLVSVNAAVIVLKKLISTIKGSAGDHP